MRNHLVAYGASLVTLLVFDAGWLSLMLKRVYKPLLGDLLSPNPLFGVAALFYLLYAVGVVVFAVDPALREKSVVTALGHGALLGFIAYATYDLTNMATLRGWSGTLTVIDMTWGAVLTGIAAAVAYLAAARFG